MRSMGEVRAVDPGSVCVLRSPPHPASPQGGEEDERRRLSDLVRPTAQSYLSTAPPLSAQSLKAPRLYTVAKPKSFSTLPLSAERPPEAQ